MKRNTMIALALLFVGLTASVTLKADHLNLTYDRSDYQDAESFQRMCEEYNDELPNKEAVCLQAWPQAFQAFNSQQNQGQN